MAKPLKKDPVAEAAVPVSDESIYEQMVLPVPTVSASPAKPAASARPVAGGSKAIADKPPAHAVTGASTLKVLPPSEPRKPARPSALPTWSTPPLRAQKLGLMLGELTANAMSNEAGTAVLPWHMNMQDWKELMDIQQAILTRCGQQYNEWVEGLSQIAADYNQIKAANTVSKYAEQEFNVGAQFQALVSAQMTNWVGLVENIHVDYAYWLAQKREAVLSS